MVRGATIRLRSGERINIYGPPGSGKTVLLLSLVDIVVRDAGIVQIGGMDPLNHRSEILRRTCFIPQRIAGKMDPGIYISLYSSLHGLEIGGTGNAGELDKNILLRLQLMKRPGLVIIDGVEDLDSGSRRLLNSYLEEAGATLITTSREPDDGTRYDYRGYMEGGKLDVFPVV